MVSEFVAEDALYVFGISETRPSSPMFEAERRCIDPKIGL